MAVILNCCLAYDTATTTETKLFPEFMRKPNSPTILEIPMHENESLNEEEFGESAKTEQTGVEEKKTFKRTLRKLPARQRQRRISSSSNSSSNNSDSTTSSTSSTTSKSTYTDRSDSGTSSTDDDGDDESQPLKIKKKTPAALKTPSPPPLINSVEAQSRKITPPPPSPVEVPLDPRVWKAEHIAEHMTGRQHRLL